MLTKRELIYGGASLFIFLVIYASTRKEELVEAQEGEKRNFDNTKLPSLLRPPKKLAEGEPIPEGAKRNKTNSLLPRFDSW
jgi:hypothetical protein